MISAVLLLAHGGLGLLALGSAWVPVPWRGRVLVSLCVLGAGFGIALVVMNGSLEEWRAVELSGVATVAGAAIAAAWLVAAVVAAPEGRALSCALVGIACSSMALAVMSEWVVPALLFWLCSSLALAGLASHARSGPWVWVVLFASDAALVAALFGNWVDTRSWVLPDALEGWTFYVLVAAVALRAGVVPLFGTWSLLGRASPAIPLLVGGSFCILRVALGDGDPWAGSVLFVAALAVALVVLFARRPWGGIGAAAAAPIATMLGLAVIAPASISAAGTAAVVTAAVAALWLASSEEGAPDRVVALVALPPSLGFIAAAIAVVAALANTVAADDTVDTVSWTLALVLGPLALTASLAVATRLAATLPAAPGWFGRLRTRQQSAYAVLIVRLLLALSIAGAILPGDWLGIQAGVAAWDERRAILFGTAIVLAAAAAWFAARRTVPAPTRARPASFRASAWVDSPPTGTIAARALTAASLLLVVGAIGVVGWLTFEGLRLGFL
ncbi:MAG: hypothetical protein M3174_07755 [Actinomycetota bacterium]|nr:hypothetical protein [Actinomycetota bacterium]